jgi:hypothetical protein
MSYAEWVTRSKIRSSSLRETLAHRMNENASLSWQSPNAMNGGSSSRGGDRIDELLLGGQVRKWPTTQANDSTAVRNATSNRSNPDSEHHDGVTMADAVRNWPSPAARDQKGPNGEMHWETKERPHEDQLPNAVVNWTTPQAHDNSPRGAGNRMNPNAGNACLASDAIDFPCSPLGAGTNPTPIIPTGGLGLLLQRWRPPQCRALNATFQHWLMGWPVRMNCESAATAWSLWRRRMRSRLSFLLCFRRIGGRP